jgi:superfamily I DNA/RNA helicase
MTAAPLNPAQLEAVHHLKTPCLVLAGAGAGLFTAVGDDDQSTYGWRARRSRT